MAKTMTPSAVEQEGMTDGQIDKAVALYRAMLIKHRSELGSEPAQLVLGQPDLVGEMVGVLRRRVEAVSNLVVRRVTVDRSRTQQQVLDATGRKQYTDGNVVAAMPRGEGEEVEVIFFNLGRYVSDDKLEGEYELRGLKPADPYSLAAVNEADPAFADERPNGTHWKGAGGNWCYTAFHRWDGEREVHVNRNDDGWDDDWWFAGLRK